MPVSNHHHHDMFTRYCAIKSNNIWGVVVISFTLMDYQEFKENNIFDWYIDGAWEMYKCEIIHYYISTLPDQCQQLILAIECPLEGRSRGLYIRIEHSPKFSECEDCNLPWILTNM